MMRGRTLDYLAAGLALGLTSLLSLKTFAAPDPSQENANFLQTTVALHVPPGSFHSWADLHIVNREPVLDEERARSLEYDEGTQTYCVVRLRKTSENTRVIPAGRVLEIRNDHLTIIESPDGDYEVEREKSRRPGNKVFFTLAIDTQYDDVMAVQCSVKGDGPAPKRITPELVQYALAPHFQVSSTRPADHGVPRLPFLDIELPWLRL